MTECRKEGPTRNLSLTRYCRRPNANLRVETYVINRPVQLRYEVEVPRVRIEFEGGEQGPHDLVEDVGLWVRSLLNTRGR